MSKSTYENYEYHIPKALDEGKDVYIQFSNEGIIVSEYIKEDAEFLWVSHQKFEYMIQKNKIEFIRFMNKKPASVSSSKPW